MYLLLHQKSSRAHYKGLWLRDCESILGRNDEPGPSFKNLFVVLLIQRQVRRFLAYRKALEPGHGVFFLQSKRRFEDNQAAAAAATGSSVLRDGLKRHCKTVRQCEDVLLAGLSYDYFSSWENRDLLLHLIC